MNYKARNQNPSDSWLAPEHGRMAQGMRRPRNGIKDKEGLWIVRPGERILPEPECMRLQRETEHRLNRSPRCRCDICVHDAKVAYARNKSRREVGFFQEIA